VTPNPLQLSPTGLAVETLLLLLSPSSLPPSCPDRPRLVPAVPPAAHVLPQLSLGYPACLSPPLAIDKCSICLKANLHKANLYCYGNHGVSVDFGFVAQSSRDRDRVHRLSGLELLSSGTFSNLGSKVATVCARLAAVVVALSGNTFVGMCEGVGGVASGSGGTHVLVGALK
jgi:hypothetical protein